jgi:Flp pilus assembly protein TadD
MLLAEAELAAGAPGEAVNALRRLTTQRPGDATLRLALGRALSAAGRRSEARTEYQQVLRDDPGSIEAMLGLGRIALSERRAEEALEMARRLQARAPTAASGWALQGDAELLRGRLEPALAAYGVAKEREPSSDLVRQIARVELRSGDAEGAIRALQDWLDTQPDDLQARLALAITLQSAGRNTLAEAQYQQLLHARPDNVTALNNLAWLYHERGDDRSLEYARRAHELAPESVATTDTLGWILLEREEIEEAVVLLERAAAQTRDASVHYHLGVARARAGDSEGAREVLSQLLGRGQDFPEHADARALLDRL